MEGIGNMQLTRDKSFTTGCWHDSLRASLKLLLEKNFI
jgi:hypothetical protein